MSVLWEYNIFISALLLVNLQRRVQTKQPFFLVAKFILILNIMQYLRFVF